MDSLIRRHVQLYRRAGGARARARRAVGGAMGGSEVGVLAAYELDGLRATADAIARGQPPARTGSRRDGARPATGLHLRRYLVTQVCAVTIPELAAALHLHRTTVWRSCALGRALVARAITSGTITRDSVGQLLRGDGPPFRSRRGTRNGLGARHGAR